MTEQSFPFAGQTTTDAQYRILGRHLHPISGVKGTAISSDLQVTANSSGMQVFVAAGEAFLQGCIYQTTASVTVPISAANTTVRTDVVVLNLDPTAQVITCAVVQGAPGGSTPALTQTSAGIYQIPLAYITVRANTTTIAPGDVLDARLFETRGTGLWTDANRGGSFQSYGSIGFNYTRGYHEYYDGTIFRPVGNQVGSVLASNSGNGGAILKTMGSVYVGAAPASVVPQASARNVRVDIHVQVASATASVGRYRLNVLRTTDGSAPVAASASVGPSAALVLSGTGTQSFYLSVITSIPANASSAYTFDAGVKRTSGGDAGDDIEFCQVIVTDVGWAGT